jgi:hypothetical protein
VTETIPVDSGSVNLYWLPLGAGDAPGSSLVRLTGRVFEAVAAGWQHRARCDLYHSALEVSLDGVRRVIEMTPVWGQPSADRGVVGEGSVGLPWLGRSRLFRYEVRRWSDGVIPDLDTAVASPRQPDSDRARAERLLELVGAFPLKTWGQDEMGTGEMWNSNSLTAWLLARSGHRTDDIAPPAGGRAPGWSAGLVAARRAP